MTSKYLKLFNRYRAELALIVICTAVFVPRVVTEYEPSSLWFGDIPYYIFTTRSLVEDGDLDLKNQLDGNLEKIRDSIGLGTEGEWYMTHPVLMSVAAIPFHIFMGTPGFLVFNVAVLILMVLVTLHMARLFAPEWAAFVTALIFAFTTQIPPTLMNFSPDAFAGLLTLFGVLFVLKDRPLWAGFFWGLAILARTPNVVPYAAVFPVLLFRSGGIGRTLRFLAGSVPCIALFLILNEEQWGGFLTLGYSRCIAVNAEGQAVLTNIAGHFGAEHFLGGAWGQLVDRDHGLLFTNLVALIALPGLWELYRKNRPAAIHLILTAGSVYVFHAFFKLWHISHDGANRYLFTTILVMGVPFAVLLSRAVSIHALVRDEGVLCNREATTETKDEIDKER